MEEVMKNIVKDMKKMKQRTRKLTLFAFIAGLCIVSLELKNKEQAEKIRELNEIIGNQTTEGV